MRDAAHKSDCACSSASKEVSASGCTLLDEKAAKECESVSPAPAAGAPTAAMPVMPRFQWSRLFWRLWDSPTVTTWASFLTRSLSLVLVTPLVLRQFNPAEIALWYLFLSLIGMQTLVDLGFSPCFSRAVAYAMGGQERLEDIIQGQLPASAPAATNREPNWTLIAEILATMRTTYGWLSLGLFLLFSTAGTWALIRPISSLTDPPQGWISWSVVIVATTVMFRYSFYSAFLQGINRIAVLRRWEALFAVSGVTLVATLLKLNYSLVCVVVTSQVWSTIGSVYTRHQAASVSPEVLARSRRLPFNPKLFAWIWPAAWRSGAGVLLSSGVVQGSGLLYAQLGSTSSVASYLFSMRIMQSVVVFSAAPFYSKLPLLARFYSSGQRDRLIDLARRGMAKSHWVFICGAVGLGLFVNPLLNLIHAQIRLVEPHLWVLIVGGFFLERYGAMHIQLYTLTNRVIWHIANTVSGLIYLLLALLLLPHYGVYAFPVGMIIGYLSFYSWYTAWHSYRCFRMNFLEFERRSVLVPALLYFAFAAMVLFTGRWH